MSLNKLHSIYFLGIGGIGMSALARYFTAKGISVCGYDKTETALTSELIKEGIDIHFDENLSSVKTKIVSPTNEEKDGVLIVYTPAIPKSNTVYQYFLNNQYNFKKRSEVLGEITQSSFTIAVGGTHGKTSTSSMVAHIIKQSSKGCNAFLGGITQNYNTNFLVDANSNIVVVEADEYDRSFLTLFPDVAVITSMDADHLDIYGDKESVAESFLLFANQVKNTGVLISKKGLPLPTKSGGKHLNYSSKDRTDFYADNISISNGNFEFDFISKIESVKNVKLQMPGRHNVENAVAAMAAAQLTGISASEIKSGIESFKGVKRRFEYQIKNENLVFIDDYAHHPEELKACITAVKEMFPDKKITGVFQPHLFSRTRDFALEFAQSLDLLDECFLLDIYPARELPIAGVTSEIVLDKMTLKTKKIVAKEELISSLANTKLEVLITLGAGDIDKLIEPIKSALNQNCLSK